MKYVISVLMGILLFSITSPLYAVTGVIKPFQTAELSSELNGVISSVLVNVGQKVLQGEVLLTFKCGIFNAEKLRAEAELDGAKVKVEVNEKLVLLNSIGQESYILSKSALKQAQAQYQIATINTEKCIVRAPFNGVVAKINIKPFDTVQLSQPKLTLVQIDKAIVEFVTSLEDGQNIRMQDTIKVEHPLYKTSLDASIHIITPVVETVSQTRIFQAVIEQFPQDWVVGSSVTITLP